ncbi:MAG TPA: DUF1592 domain-containing protein [Polyangia bacterium]
MIESRRNPERGGGLRTGRLLALVTLLAAPTAACTGSIGGSEGMGPDGVTPPGAGGSSGTNPPGSGGTGVVPPGTPPPPKDFVPEPAGLRRLTAPQYRNSVADIFERKITFNPELEEDTELSGLVSIGAARVGFSQKIVEQFEAAGREAAHLALSDAAVRSGLVGCAPTTVTDDTCTKNFLKKIGRRAFRRPLTDEELNRYTMVAVNAQNVTKNFFTGLEYGVAGLLQSPNFLFRVEMGTPNPQNPKQVVFDDFELATRLSYLLWNSTPDDALLDAAEARQLTKANGLLTQTERLLTSERAAVGVETFVREVYQLNELDDLRQSATVFPLRTPTLGASMRTETMKFFSEIALSKDRDLREIFDSRSTWMNGELAKLYGVTGITGTNFVKANLPANGIRLGILGHAGFLSAHGYPTRGSATLRGKFIREAVLCQNIPLAPPDIPTLPETGNGTAREKLAIHRTDPYCNSCHSVMDPIGLGLENFDGIGQLRTMEAGKVIDASGELDGTPFKDPIELAAAIKNHKEATACLARSLYRYAVGHLDSKGEEPVINAMTEAFKGGNYRFRALAEALVKSPGFVLAAKE